jgi:hypothetical protein
MKILDVKLYEGAIKALGAHINERYFCQQLKKLINGKHFDPFLYSVIFCPAIGFITMLLKAKLEQLIVLRIDESSLLLQTIYQVLQMGKKKEDNMCI